MKYNKQIAVRTPILTGLSRLGQYASMHCRSHPPARELSSIPKSSTISTWLTLIGRIWSSRRILDGQTRLVCPHHSMMSLSQVLPISVSELLALQTLDAHSTLCWSLCCLFYHVSTLAFSWMSQNQVLVCRECPCEV